MIYRLAETKDIDQLIRMRWDFTYEDHKAKRIDEGNYKTFYEECCNFLESALNSEEWFIWVAEDNGRIVSHIYTELIQKVPRPGRITRPFAFMTNVYTLKDYRNKGIGSILLSTINEWVRDEKYEFVIVWPSDYAINFYKKNGYVQCQEPMEFFPS
ncbi:GNAT family N-acetyltransferase [Neobacillus terrae]|uniref:GNAT family N-acetyltransferase n=1 Tax=Neobacillus terrae TaxID=3034837 RepID=UPI00140A5586|nr:GNAT family N-acetyltransferase [Neobacillus terrae]NHM31908.1 GNAT family N-acetyltransferase [Neobacillus terrae]